MSLSTAVVHLAAEPSLDAFGTDNGWVIALKAVLVFVFLQRFITTGIAGSGLK